MSEKWRLVVAVPVLKRGNRSIYNCVIIEAHHWSISVSYTHLDVYKRQVKAFALFVRE